MNTDRPELAAAVVVSAVVVVVSADLQAAVVEQADPAAVAVVDLVDLAQKVVDLGLVVPVVKAVDRVDLVEKVADPVEKADRVLAVAVLEAVRD